ncbi:MAG: serine/threonine-protein kinase, partial [Candidatus Bathyarchaeia archaeon]
MEGVKEGGIGIVYFVYFVHRERDEPERFVLKTLKPQFMEYAEMREIFRREAELWIRLSSHPNIVSAYRIIEEGNELYILAERIMPDSNFGCVSAEDWLQRRPFWPLEGINFAIQICRAMHWAQRQIPGFIHRDIKPGNMLIAGDTIKLSDFGFGGTVAEIDFLSGKPVGTIWYMSPEVIRREKATVRSDVYSFGATLYHMFSGRPVFTGSEREIKEAHLNEVPELLEKLCK